MAIADRHCLSYRFACTGVINKPRTKSQLWDGHSVRKRIGFVENHSSSSCSARGGAALVLLVSDLFHPLNGFAVQRLLDGDMGHRSGRRGAVPVLLARL